MEIIIALAVVGLLALFFIAQYNRLIRLNISVDESFAQIEVQLKRRSDLIPNLVETVKGYAKHEQMPHEAVVKLNNLPAPTRNSLLTQYNSIPVGPMVANLKFTSPTSNTPSTSKFLSNTSLCTLLTTYSSNADYSNTSRITMQVSMQSHPWIITQLPNKKSISKNTFSFVDWWKKINYKPSSPAK